MTQTIDLAAFGAAKANTRKELALLAYDGAKGEPEGANWEAVADMLRACFPAVRAARKDASGDDRAAPVWWRDYRTVSRKSDRAVVEVCFADGRVQRASALSLAGKGFNIGGALRLAVAWYRVKCRDEHAPVPEFESVTVPDTGETFDPVACNRMTAELRAPVVVAAPIVDVESRLAGVQAELERRKGARSREAARFAAEIADTTAPVTQFQDGSLREYSAEEWKSYLGRRAARVDSEFATAIRHGEAELEKLRARMAPVVESEAEIEAAEPIGEAMLADEVAAEIETEAPAVVAAPYTLSPARYAKGMTAVRTIANDGYKSRACRLASSLANGRWSGRCGAYIMSPRKAEKFVRLYGEGWDASSYSGELEPPKVETPAEKPRVRVKAISRPHVVACEPAPAVVVPVPRMRVPLHLLASTSAVAYRVAA